MVKVLAAIALYHITVALIVFLWDKPIYKLKKILTFSIKIVFYTMEFLCNNTVARHTLIMTGKTSFNLGNASLFFSMSGWLVTALGYPQPDLLSFTIYGTILTVGGYILSNCKNLKR